MATSARGFVITLAIYIAITLAVIVFFSLWRRLRKTKKFYSPKLYQHTVDKPPKLSKSFIGWVPEVWGQGEDELVRFAGMDAAVYIKFLRMLLELFFIISLISLIIIMPINLTGGEVDRLMEQNGYATETSNYTWWIPPAPPANNASTTDENGSLTAVDTVDPPEMYNDSIPDPPPGLIWWQYLPGVPPLASPEETLGPSYSNYGWRYDDAYTTISYYFSDLDKTTMANIPAGSDSLYAHALITWLVTAVCMWQFWRYCGEMLRLRLFYLLHTPRGAQSHSVLCTDIPGVAYGTIPQRLDGTVLKLVPKSVKDKAYDELNRLERHGTHASHIDQLNAVDIEAAAGGENTKNTTTAPATKTASSEQKQPDVLQHEDTLAIKMQELASLKTFQVPDRWDEACNQLDEGNHIQGVVDTAFKEIYDDRFSHAHVVYNTWKLDGLVTQYEGVKIKLIDTIDRVFAAKNKGTAPIPKERTVVLGAKMDSWGKEKFGLKPKKVDALTFRRELFEHLYEEILKEQEIARSSTGNTFPSAFITFDSRKATVIAAHSMMSEDLTTWRCQAAPGPEEVIWRNLGLRSWEKTTRYWLMVFVFFVMMMFFMIPVTAIQGLLSLDSLGITWVQDIAILNALFTSILPSLVLTIFLAIVPLLLALMNRWAGMVSQSEIDHGVVSRYFIFQVITVFLGSFIAGTFANQLQQMIDDPSSVVTIFGTSAPQVGIFFTNFIMLRAGVTVPVVQLLRLFPLIVFLIRNRMTATNAAKARLRSNQRLKYGKVVPTDTLNALLGVTFCLISPLIAPIAFFYYAIAYLVRKYGVIWAYKPQYESGGMLWKRCFNQCVAGLITYQFMMVFILAIKKTVAPPLIVLPLPLITVAFLVAAHRVFWQPMLTLSLLSAAKLDKLEARLGGAMSLTEVNTEVAERYLSPSFKVDKEEHAKLVAQAKIVEEALENDTVDELQDFGGDESIEGGSAYSDDDDDDAQQQQQVKRATDSAQDLTAESIAAVEGQSKTSSVNV